MKKSFLLGALAAAAVLVAGVPPASATPVVGGTGLASNAENMPVSVYELGFTITSAAADVVTADPELIFELQRDGTNLDYTCVLDMATAGLNTAATTASISIQPWNPTVDPVVKSCDFPTDADTGKGYIPEGTYTIRYKSVTAAAPTGTEVSLSTGVRILHNDLKCEGGATKGQATNYCAGKYTSDDVDNKEDEYKGATIGLGIVAGLMTLVAFKFYREKSGYTSTSA